MSYFVRVHTILDPSNIIFFHPVLVLVFLIVIVSVAYVIGNI